MVQSDVVAVGIKQGRPFAVDTFISSVEECNTELRRGTCPDSVLANALVSGLAQCGSCYPVCVACLPKRCASAAYNC